MSHKHHTSSDCCYPMTSGYGVGGYGAGAVGTAGYGAGAGYANGGIRWIYALLILIVIVLQFGRRNDRGEVAKTGCCDGGEVATSRRDGLLDNQLIDNSVLFIIVVFLLILCAGCFGAGTGATAGAGYGGGYGY